MFPLMMTTTLLWLIVVLIIFQGGVAQSGAARASEAAVLHWDNSKRGASGLPAAGVDDGLYWRLAEDNLLQGLLQLASPEDGQQASVTVALPLPVGGNGAAAGSLTAIKLGKAGSRLSPQLHGEMMYKRGVLNRQAETRLRLPMGIPSRSGKSGEVRASAIVTDPVEFIRSVDLVRYYTAKFQASRDMKAASAGKALKDYAAGRP
ncbi:hypothetical protein CGZ75_12025 [Paenibacillus herberti]|uniref:Uncharacterized protein n=1 Tax=Paenibacillus herberti TaxID=1619309 RepID=A0A229P5F6_9BACL|nr:hypothetical protein CGZ75_12025 [Paenibacillus herberti]